MTSISKWSKVTAGIYTAVGTESAAKYVISKHDPLTWQDRPYWLIKIDGEPVVRNAGQLRSRRFRTLVDAKEFAELHAAGKRDGVCNGCGENIPSGEDYCSDECAGE